jgi:hypothetical protein
MRPFWPRLLKSVLPIALLAGGVGYLFAQAAGAYVATARDDGSALTESLAWRVPLSMAAWGGGIALLFEVFRHLWSRSKPTPNPVVASSDVPDAEQLLMQLLEQAEAAEHNRNQPDFPVAEPPPIDTPMPAALPARQPTPAA